MGLEQNLKLRDNADTFVSVRWLNNDGVPYQLSAVVAQVRATPDNVTVLVAAVATLGAAPDHWATLRFRAIDVEPATFEALTEAAHWDAVATRLVDGAKAVVAEGRVVWTRGVTR